MRTKVREVCEVTEQDGTPDFLGLPCTQRTNSVCEGLLPSVKLDRFDTVDYFRDELHSGVRKRDEPLSDPREVTCHHYVDRHH